MLRQALNNVNIIGILSEIDLDYGSINKNGRQVETIGGTIKVKVVQNGTELEVPIHMFATKQKNNGDPNPAFASIEEVMKKYISIAAAGGETGADRVRINGARIQMNEYYSRDGRLVSFPRITASFVNHYTRSDFAPTTSFEIEMAIASKYMEVVNGEETGRMIVKGIVPMYGGKVDVIDFVCANANVANSVDTYWNVGDTVKARGRLNFSVKTEIIKEDQGFGEPIEKTRTTNVSELVIIGGSEAPYEDDLAFAKSDVDAALAERKNRLEILKNKAEAKPAPAAPSYDLGF